MSFIAIKDYTNIKQYKNNALSLSFAMQAPEIQYFASNPNYTRITDLTYLKKVIAAYYNDAGLYGSNGAGYSISNSDYSSAEVEFYPPSYSGTGYEQIIPINEQIVMYVKIQSVSELSDESLYYFHPVLHTAAGQMYAIRDGASFDYSTFISTYGSKKIITEISFYSDATIPRTLIGKVFRPVSPATNKRDLLFRFSATEARSVLNGYTEWHGNFDIYTPVLANLFMSFIDRTVYNAYGNCHGRSVGAVANLHTLNGDIDTILASESSPADNARIYDTRRYIIFDNESTITKYLNMLNVPFAYSSSDAINTPVDDLPDFVPIGQGENTTGGGDGTGDNTSDSIENYSPTLTPISSFNTHYAITKSALSNLANYLWNSTFLDDIDLLFNNPMEGVISCRMFPFSIYQHDVSHMGSEEYIVIGNVTTTAYAYPIRSGYNCVFNMGSITIDEYYGSAMDYAPYTTIHIYLPYIGIKELEINDCMGKTLNIKYVVDITTGACIAEIFSGSQLLYTYDGKMGVEVPINSSNAAQFVSSLALTGITAAAGVGIGAATGNPLAIAGTVLSTAKSVAGNQLHINKGGSNSPFAGLFMPQYCYVIINRPIQSLASSFGATFGFPCNVTKTLSTLTGFTQIDEVHITGINATSDEITEIYNLLKQGVIL